MGDAAVAEIDDSNDKTDMSKDGGEDPHGNVAREAGADAAWDDGEGGMGELASDTDKGIDVCNGPGENNM